MSRFYKILIILLAFFTAGFSNLFAAKIWTGSQGNNWSNASNWQPSGVPGAHDDVVFSYLKFPCYLGVEVLNPCLTNNTFKFHVLIRP
jgi:hypothetical protein